MHVWQVVAALFRQVAQGLAQVVTHWKLLFKLKPFAHRLHPNEVQLEQFAEHIEQPPVELL